MNVLSGYIGQICFVTVLNMADLNKLFHTVHVSCCIGKQALLLVGFHQTEQLARLCIVIIVVFTETPSFDITVYLFFNFIKFRFLIPYSITVWFIV